MIASTATNRRRLVVILCALGIGVLSLSVLAVGRDWISTTATERIHHIVAGFLGPDDSKGMDCECLPSDSRFTGRYRWAVVTWPPSDETPFQNKSPNEGTVLRLRVDLKQQTVDNAAWEFPRQQATHTIDQDTALATALEYARAHYPVTWPEGMQLRSQRHRPSAKEGGGGTYHFGWSQRVNDGDVGNFCGVTVSEVDGRVLHYTAKWHPPPTEFPEVRVDAEKAYSIVKNMLEEKLNNLGYPYKLQIDEPQLVWRTRGGKTVPVWQVGYIDTVFFSEEHHPMGAAVIMINGLTGKQWKDR